MTELHDLIDPDAEQVQLGSGYEFTEGPSWSVPEQALIFSDIPADVRYRWTEGDDAPVSYVTPNTSLVSRFTGDGGREVVASHFEGKELNSPNDIVTAADGTIYFTDPNYGRWNDWIGLKRDHSLDFQGVFRCAPDGSGLELIAPRDEFEQPNGLCFSPDESILYVNDSPRSQIKAFDMNPDGSVGPSRVFFDNIGTGETGGGTPDGMKVDELGNVWASGPGGVWIIDPDGNHLGTVSTPQFPGNLCWGGADLKTLFVCSTTTVFAVRTKVASAPLPCHR